MAELDVGRLTIRTHGLSSSDGKRLAEHIVRHLADTPTPAGGKERPGRERAEIQVEAISDIDGLARRIAAEIMREIG